VKKKSAEDSLMYALIQNSLGNLYFEKGDYKKAELYYQSALDIRGKVVGVYHPDYGISLGCFGEIISSKQFFQLFLNPQL
jgi:tetratricopeptide (TPR) repeat protein